MYKSDTENRQHQSLLEHRCCQITNADVKKIRFADPAIGGSALRWPQDDGGN